MKVILTTSDPHSKNESYDMSCPSQQSVESLSHWTLGSSFLEHPLCKEMNIGGLVQDGSVKRKRRSIERRCAMDLVTKLHINPSELHFDTRNTSPRLSDEDPFLSRPLFRRIPYSMHDDNDGPSIPYHARGYGSPCHGTHRDDYPYSSALSTSSGSHHDSPASSKTIWSDVRKRDSKKSPIENTSDISQIRCANASPNACSTNKSALRPSLLKLVSLRRESFAKFILGMDGDHTDDQDQDTGATSSNFLLEEMKRIEDQNIWNTFRKPEE